MCQTVFLMLYFPYLTYSIPKSQEVDLQIADEETRTQNVKKLAQDPTAGSGRAAIRTQED